MALSDTSSKRPAEILTEAEVSALVRAASQDAPTGIRNRAIITVLYRAGLRVDEALHLKPSDINAAVGTVAVLHGKGDRNRTAALDDGALAILQRWIDTRRQLAAGRGFRNGWLFCTLQGQPLSDRYVRAMLTRLATRAGITRRVHPHGLRHSYAAELSHEGVPVAVIQKALGHSHLSTTSLYLDHIAPADVIAVGRNRAPFNPEGAAR